MKQYFFAKKKSSKRKRQKLRRRISTGAPVVTTLIAANVINVVVEEVEEESHHFCASAAYESDSDYIQYSSDESVVDGDELSSKFKNELIQGGLPLFLKSDMGGNRSKDFSQTLVMRVVDFLSWFVISLGSTLLLCDSNCMKLLFLFIIQHSKSIFQYCDHLKTLQLKPSTIKNYIEDIWLTCKWFTMFRDCRQDDLKVAPGQFY
jgi:hypothetical protein